MSINVFRTWEPMFRNLQYHIVPYHDDVTKWKQFPRYWPFVRGIHRSPVNSPHKGQSRGALMFFDLRLNNGWVNNGEADDLRRHRVHYDVIVVYSPDPLKCTLTFFVTFRFRCGSDFDHPAGLYVRAVFTIGLLLVFIFCAVSYTSVWITVISSSSRSASIGPSPTQTEMSPNIPSEYNVYSKNLAEGRRKKLHRTAKVLTMFVAMFGLQWGFFLIYAVWHIIGTSHISNLYIHTILVNLGGVFDYFAYTYMRMKYINRVSPVQSKARKSKFVYTIPHL